MSEKDESPDYSVDINARIRELANIQSYAEIREEKGETEPKSRSEKWDEEEKLWDEIHEQIKSRLKDKSGIDEKILE